MALSTVSGILTRAGMGRLGRLGLEPAIRYERSRPGELVHVDVQKLGRIQGGAGWRVRGGAQHYNPTFIDRNGKKRNTVGYEYVHIAVDDYSRLAYAEVLSDENAVTAARFLVRSSLLPPLRHQGRTRHQRQWVCLHRCRPRRRLSPPPTETPPHARLPAQTN
jgi:hypothetical protein